MKKGTYLFIAILVILGTFSSCEDFLEEDNKSGLTADAYYGTLEGIEALVNSCYTPMRFWYGKEDGIALTETGTDIFTRGNGMENPPVALYNAELNGANQPIEFHWTRLYSALNTCNAAIGRIPESPLSEELKVVREAEARFLRAFYLWHIVETWGGVHLSLEEVENIQETANRTSEEDFYNQIFTDLEFAINNLPETSSQSGRAIKPAAEGFMARMLLTRGQYQEAASYAKNVIENYNFQLEDNYADLWDINNVQNSEVVFNVNFTANLVFNEELDSPEGDITIRGGGNQAHLFFLMTYDQLPGMMRTIDYGRPFARFMPTAHLLDLFDESIDARYDATFQTVWYCNNEANAPEGMQIGDTAIYATKYVVPQSVKDESLYTIIDRSRTYGDNDQPIVRDRFMSLKKFLDPSRETISQQQGKRDAFVIRLAEMYLIVAEAEMETNPAEAVEYFNEVRRRAAIDGSETAMEITADQLDIDMILDERAREFAGEQLRWFDLKRTGQLVERVQQWNPDAASNIQPYHRLRPIPQSQLDAVTNKDEFTQNEGYNM
ncbi:RagB/SusD family nutrient uptake outer membrane protein [Zunongwangia atlantica]|uniref:RagB/SusD domain-containing protein n=1 Tax=Zunongwangia atlantica 22II14-10F7 TaxID=1185767 RepID=A0A1Y1T8H2_9FLAO|nr:RagB/SusD family nutrient uptake outer membrane protein [Zunongwangia atlantica]ORL47358.1 RagB/SusD domain-containing protein [Zunongwangia atlantica 22II14-10F7]